MSLKFFSTGNQPFQHLDAATGDSHRAGFVGQWATLELQPDLFAPQCFSVGVVVQAPNNRLHYHLLGDFKKFECIYGDLLPKKVISEMLAHAEEVLRLAVQKRQALGEVDFGSVNLRLSTPAHTSGESAEVIIERIYKDVVVVEPGLGMRVRHFEAIDTMSVRQMVNQALKSIAGSDFERIVIDSKGGVMVPGVDRSHYLDVNLKTRAACGSVISAVYKTVQITEMNLLRANLDLTTFAKLRNLNEKGVFLMLPDRSQLERNEWDRIENIVGDHSWKLEQDGFRVVSLDSAIDLAKEIYDWAKPTL